MMAVGAAAVIYLVARGNVLTSQTAQEGILISDNSLVSTDNVMMQKATAFYIIGLYIKLLFFPHPMSCDYSFNEIKIVGFDNCWRFHLSSFVAIGVYALVRLPKKGSGFVWHSVLSYHYFACYQCAVPYPKHHGRQVFVYSIVGFLYCSGGAA
ncbi:MAG: DUF1736 domain-containing protein [Bacteroidetes bacterium]|nr:DUF1736 domain-containing protein [Bacteroidota bacterium]